MNPFSLAAIILRIGKKKKKKWNPYTQSGENKKTWIEKQWSKKKTQEMVKKDASRLINKS